MQAHADFRNNVVRLYELADDENGPRFLRHEGPFEVLTWRRYYSIPFTMGRSAAEAYVEEYNRNMRTWNANPEDFDPNGTGGRPFPN